MALAERAIAALDTVIAALPDGGERREGQRTMTAAVADAIEAQSHLVVQVGTGIGKSQLRSGATAGSTPSSSLVTHRPRILGGSLRMVSTGSSTVSCGYQQRQGRLIVDLELLHPRWGRRPN